jgi:hypothetical protein
MSPKALAPVAARFAVAAGLMLAAGGASAGVAGAWPQPTPSPVPPLPSADVAGAGPTSTPSTPPRPPGPITTIDHDGTYAVGTEVVPGVYSSAGPVGNGTCYWKRMGNPDGAVIDNALSKKPQVVRIDPTDKAFKTTGCQPWQQTPDANPPADAPSGPLQLTLGTLNGLLAPNGQPPPNGPQPAPGPGPAPGPPPPNGPPPPQP